MDTNEHERGEEEFLTADYADGADAERTSALSPPPCLRGCASVASHPRHPRNPRFNLPHSG